MIRGMRRSTSRRGLIGFALSGAAVMALGITLGPALAANKKPAPAPAPQRALAFAKEYSLSLSKRRFLEGKVRLQLKNIGEDDHDLTVSSGGTQFGQVFLHPGDAATVSLDLPPGSYRLFCSLGGGAHDALGMHEIITVS